MIADVFSAGSILFQILTGEEAFKGDNAKEVFLNNRSMNLTTGRFLWDGVSDIARNLCYFMLREDPSKRVTAEQCLRHKWFKNNFNVSKVG